MFLYEAFAPELIKIGLEAEDKDEVFEELVDQFCRIHKSDNREEILASLKERESKMSTGIHKGIAVPHGKTAGVEQGYGILGISKKGIDYDALDGQPVFLVFMILSPKMDTDMHLRIFRRLSVMLDNHQFFTELMAQNDPQSANRIIKKYEEIYIASNA